MIAARTDARRRAEQSLIAIVIIGGLLSIWIVPALAFILVSRLEFHGLISDRTLGPDSIVWGSRRCSQPA